MDIERVVVPNPRRDLRKWADFRPVYGYFFPQIFDAYPGSIREASQVIRVLLTVPRSPDVAQAAGALGTDEVLRRIRAVI